MQDAEQQRRLAEAWEGRIPPEQLSPEERRMLADAWEAQRGQGRQQPAQAPTGERMNIVRAEMPEETPRELQRGGGSGGLESVLQGATFGFSDEIQGGMSAAARFVGNRAQDAAAAAGLMEVDPNRPTPGDAYRTTTDAVRNNLAYAREQAPILTTVGEIGGGASSAGLGLMRMGALTGGAIAGGTYSVGSQEGNVGDRLTSAKTYQDAALGAVGGKALDMAATPVASRFQAVLRQRLNPRQQADEFGIQLTRGQATDDFLERSFEDSASKGGRGAEAVQIMRPFFQEQRRQALEAGRRLAGGTRESVNDAGFVVAKGVKDRERELKEAVNQAYDQARSMDAKLTAESVPSMVEAVVRGVDEDVLSLFQASAADARESFPQAVTALRSTQRLTGELSESVRGGTVRAVDFARIERHRGLLNKLASNADKPEDRRAVLQMKSALDGWLDKATDDALFSGDPDFLRAYQRARSLRTQYGRRFEGSRNNPGGEVLRDIVQKDADEVQTINYIFGVSKISGGDKVAPTVKVLKETLGEGSDEFQALREAAVMRLMSQAERSGRDRLGAKALADTWADALRGKQAPVMRELFTPEELARMARYEQAIRTLVPPEGSVNTSATQLERVRAGLDRAASILPSGLANAARRTNAFLGGVRRDPNAIRAQRAVTGGGNPPRPVNQEVAAAGALTPQALQEER